MADQRPFHVAIVGGGLGGISLGIALQRRSITFTLYERGKSFTEIGAGINLGRSAVRSLRLIDPSLGEKVYKLATRNPVPNENVWMDLRYGAAWKGHQDGEVFHRIMSPPTGNMTFHRQEILALLAEEMGEEYAKFNKKLEGYEQSDDRVTLRFSDGTEETASVLVGCDGIHSKVRSCMFGAENPLSKPVFSQSGCYRAVLPVEKAIEAIGESARLSTLTFTPKGYLITYPVSGGTKMNCGAWTTRPEKWTHPEWTLPNQGVQFKEDFKDWGPRTHKILALFDQDPAFWATFQHMQHPDSFVDGLVILIGDGAHSMPPHQGAGASQALEDAYVLAEALAYIGSEKKQNIPASRLKAALKAVEEVRAPRFTTIHRYSTEGAGRFFGLWEQKLEGEALQEWIAETERRLKWTWDGDLAVDAAKVEALLNEQWSTEK